MQVQTPDSPHVGFMRHALALAATTIGQTWPNPSVGCVIVKGGKIIGTGFTQAGGRPHAETEALKEAGAEASGATAYCTLEPCAHHGQTPPCAEALITAGITKVIVGCSDPDPRVSGQGITLLKEADIEVIEGICEDECLQFNAGFFTRLKTGKPFVAMKIATSLDGMIATASGESQWITGEEARNYGHMLRATHDAIITGIGTALADNPKLTCRLPNMAHRSPLRILLDSKLQLPEDAALIEAEKLWVFTTEQAESNKIKTLEAKGIRVITMGKEQIELEPMLVWLGEQGLTRILVEAGIALSQNFYPLAQRLYWFRAPLVIGEGGKAALPLVQQNTKLSDIPRFTRESFVPLGKDHLEIYSR